MPYLFQSMNMKHFGRRKVRKYKEIKGGDEIVTLNVLAKFDSLNKMETTSLESKGKLGRSGKGVGNRSYSQDQSKLAKMQKGKIYHCKCQHEGPF